MEIKTYFEDIKSKIIEELENAKISIFVVVSVFSDYDIFKILLEKVKEGLHVEIIQIKSSDSIAYQQLYDEGCKIWLLEEETIINNKFCVIDRASVISGSYNWTKEAVYNHENIMVTRFNDQIVSEYLIEFKEITTKHFGSLGEIYNSLILRLRAVQNLILLKDHEAIQSQLSKLKQNSLILENNISSKIKCISDSLKSKDYEKANTYIDLTLKKIEELDTYTEYYEVNGNGEFSGILSSKRGMITPYKYHQIGEFHNGFAWVRINKKCGFVNENGEEVIPLIYDVYDKRVSWDSGYKPFYELKINKFSDGLICLRKNGKFGFLNSKGDTIIDFKYDGAFDFVNGYAKVGFYFRPEYFLNSTFIDVTKLIWGFIDVSGNEIIKIEHGTYFVDGIRDFSEGIVNISSEGFFNINNNKITDVYNLAKSDFSEGLGLIKDGGNNFYFVNKLGTTILDLQKKYCYCESFKNGLALVARNKREWKPNNSYNIIDSNHSQYMDFGFIDKKGSEIIQSVYDKYITGDAKFIWLKDSVGYFMVSYAGVQILPNRYDYVLTDSFKGVFIVKKDNKWGLVNSIGEEILKLKYNSIERFDELGIARVKLDNKIGFVNFRGKEIIKPIYNAAWGFLDGVVCVELNNKWGYFNRLGNEITPIIYNWASYCRPAPHAGVFQNTIDGVKVTINMLGESVVFRETSDSIFNS